MPLSSVPPVDGAGGEFRGPRGQGNGLLAEWYPDGREARTVLCEGLCDIGVTRLRRSSVEKTLFRSEGNEVVKSTFWEDGEH